MDANEIKSVLITNYDRETGVFTVTDSRDGKRLALMTSNQARHFADVVGDILTGKSYLITHNLSLDDLHKLNGEAVNNVRHESP